MKTTILTLNVFFAFVISALAAEEVKSKLEAPLSAWSFVVMVNGNDKGETTVTVIKDNKGITALPENLPEIKNLLTQVYQKLNKEPFMYSMTEVDGRKFTRHKVITPDEVNMMKKLFFTFTILPRPLREREK